MLADVCAIATWKTSRGWTIDADREPMEITSLCITWLRALRHRQRKCSLRSSRIWASRGSASAGDNGLHAQALLQSSSGQFESGHQQRRFHTFHALQAAQHLQLHRHQLLLRMDFEDLPSHLEHAMASVARAKNDGEQFIVPQAPYAASRQPFVRHVVGMAVATIGGGAVNRRGVGVGHWQPRPSCFDTVGGTAHTTVCLATRRDRSLRPDSLPQSSLRTSRPRPSRLYSLSPR